MFCKNGREINTAYDTCFFLHKNSTLIQALMYKLVDNERRVEVSRRNKEIGYPQKNQLPTITKDLKNNK